MADNDNPQGQGEEGQQQNPQGNATPQGDKPQFDAAAFEKKAQEKAEEIASQKVEALKDELAQSLSGKGKPDTPKTWQEVEERAAERGIKAAEERFEKRLEEQRKQTEAKQNLTLKQQEESQKAEWAQMSKEWAEAVQDGVIPDIAPAVKQKLKSNVAFSDLTDEEKNDPGLKAYNDGRLLHAKLKEEGKSTSFYRTLQKFYNKMPAGANAPVFGGGTPTANNSEELDYDAIAANRRAKFGF
jgi:hypothetical protein